MKRKILYVKLLDHVTEEEYQLSEIKNLKPAVDIDLRALCDYIVFKQQGYLQIPRDLWWIYRYIKPEWLQKCQPKYFAILSRKGAVGVGLFKLPTWHKRPRENLLKALNIRITRKEMKE